MTDSIEIAVLDLTTHSYPLDEQLELTRRYTEAGIRIWLTDQTFSWWPDGLLEPDVAPIVEQGWPKHAFWDRYVQTAWLKALVPDSKWAIALDVVRRQPDTMAQMMMTLHEFTGGDTLFALAAGEVKQLAPYGYSEDKPFTKLDETVQALQQLWTSDAPFDFDGKTLHFEGVFQGMRSSDGSLPPLTTIGMSPRLRKIAARSCEYAPVYGTVDAVEQQIAEARTEAERFGRDPDTVKFWGTAYAPERAERMGRAKYTYLEPWIYETEADREAIRTSPMAKWPAVGGWIPSPGKDSPFGADYHYAHDMVPTRWTRDRVFEVLDRVPDEDVDYEFQTIDDYVDTIVRSAEAGIDMIRFSDRSAEIVPDMRWRLSELYIEASRRAQERLAAKA